MLVGMTNRERVGQDAAGGRLERMDEPAPGIERIDVGRGLDFGGLVMQNRFPVDGGTNTVIRLLDGHGGG